MLAILFLIVATSQIPAAPAPRPSTLLLHAPGLGLSDLGDPSLPHLGALARDGALGLINGLTGTGRAELEDAVTALPAARVTAAGALRRQTASLLRAAPDRPYGVAADLNALTRAATAALERGGLVIVDPGDLERAARYAPLCFPEPTLRHRTAALADLDRLLEVLRPAVLAHGGQIFLVSDQPAASGPPYVGLWVAAGAGWESGLLRSSATRIAGMTARGDLLAALRGASEPKGAEGAPAVSVAPGGLAEVERHLRAIERVEGLRRPAWRVLQVTLLLIALLALAAPRRPRLGDALLPAVLGLFLLLLLAGDAVAPAEPARLAAHGALVAAAAGLALARREVVLPLLGAIPLLLLAEIATGGHLLRWSPLGYSVALGARSYGIGNEAVGVLLGTALLATLLRRFAPVLGARCSVLGRANGSRHARRLAGALFCRAPSTEHRARARGALAGGGLLGVTALLIGSPALGANLGGALATALVAALALPVLAGRRPRARHLALAAALLVALGLLIALWDAARPPEARTHVGRLAAAVAEGGLAPLVDVAASKATTALRVALSFWGLLLIVETAVGLFLLRKGGSTAFLLLLPAAGALLLFNDSGVIPASLCLALLPASLAATSSAARSPRSGSDRPAAERAR